MTEIRWLFQSAGLFLAALAKLGPPFLWPGLTLLCLVMYRRELRDVLTAIPKALHRITTADFMGVKVELQGLEESSAKASDDIRHLPPAPEAIMPKVGEDEIKCIQAAGEEQQHAVSSENVIVRLPHHTASLSSSAPDDVDAIAAAIDTEIRMLCATMGFLNEFQNARQAGLLLASRALLPLSLKNSIDDFYSLRARLSLSSFPKEVVTNVVAAGRKLLGLLREVPTNYHLVIARDLPVFADHKAEKEMMSVKAVMLQSLDQHGQPTGVINVFPAKMPMPLGKTVSWEWNTSNSWSQAWYKRLDSQDILKAWDNAAEFIGRALESI